MLLLTVAGCGSPDKKMRAQIEASRENSIPPAFLTGPVVVLLTNSGGFVAELEMAPASPAGMARVAGKLFAKGSRLAFTPVGSDASFLWDAGASRGHVLNAPLQGYAPTAFGCRVTGIFPGLEPPVTEVINGQTCRKTSVTVLSSNCPTANFRVWRTANAAALPVRIECIDATAQMTLELRSLQPADLADDLFLPPDGLTKYPDTETMMTELMARRIWRARGRPPSRELDSDSSPPPGVGRGRY